jgi:hypothetical protein
MQTNDLMELLSSPTTIGMVAAVYALMQVGGLYAAVASSTRTVALPTSGVILSTKHVGISWIVSPGIALGYVTHVAFLRMLGPHLM